MVYFLHIFIFLQLNKILNFADFEILNYFLDKFILEFFHIKMFKNIR